MPKTPNIGLELAILNNTIDVKSYNSNMYKIDEKIEDIDSSIGSLNMSMRPGSYTGHVNSVKIKSIILAKTNEFFITADVNDLSSYSMANQTGKWLDLLINIGENTILDTSYIIGTESKTFTQADIELARLYGANDGEFLYIIDAEKIKNSPITMKLVRRNGTETHIMMRVIDYKPYNPEENNSPGCVYKGYSVSPENLTNVNLSSGDIYNIAREGYITRQIQAIPVTVSSINTDLKSGNCLVSLGFSNSYVLTGYDNYNIYSIDGSDIKWSARFYISSLGIKPSISITSGAIALSFNIYDNNIPWNSDSDIQNIKYIQIDGLELTGSGEQINAKYKINSGDNVMWNGTHWINLSGESNLTYFAKKATTISGYGIVDAYTKTEIDDMLQHVLTDGLAQSLSVSILNGGNSIIS